MNSNDTELTPNNRDAFLSQQEEMRSYIDALLEKRHEQKSFSIKRLYKYFFQ